MIRAGLSGRGGVGSRAIRPGHLPLAVFRGAAVDANQIKRIGLMRIDRPTAVLAILLAGVVSLHAHGRYRTPVRIPDIPGYLTLKCDFHMHTVFSDGKVWPDVRAEEAWREGLDAIAITDHIEYQPHKADLPTNHNRSYEIAKPAGDTLQVIVIRGSEITRSMPPGHLNAIFLKDASKLETKNWRDAVKAAQDQGAFIFWNHPGWTGQQPDGVARWYDEHTELLQQGALKGIEVVNTRSYYPEAHRWCLEKKLTMLSNSDIHAPLNLDFDVHEGDHRPITLVFARERTAEGVREALFNRRTAVYSGEMLVGEERFLRPIFERSLVLIPPTGRIKGKGRVYAQLRNESEVPITLKAAGKVNGVTFPGELTVPGLKTVLFEIRGTGTMREGERTFRLPYEVTNWLVEPEKGLRVELPVAVRFANP
ncbi:MAG: histidinol-phosphatase [Verrucomicrobia bacterium]|nr:MAG: histidinol-phosphatase [Verrucomicrobiota bacterium]